MEQMTHKLRLDMVPPLSRTFALEKDLMIADNFDQRMPSGIESRIRAGLPTRTLHPLGPSFPYRVMFNSILFVESGQVDCKINLEDYHAKGPGILLTPSGIIVDELTYPAGTRFLIAAYTPSSHLAMLDTRSAKIIRSATYSPLYLPLTRERMDRYIQLLRIVLHVAEGGPDYALKSDIVNGFTDVISGGIARIILEQGSGRGTSSHGAHIFRKFERLVRANCRKERGLGFYAGKLCLSPKYLSRIIGETSGRSASEIIRENVILEAKVLLRSGQYNVQEVSNMLSFPNASFFGRYFREATGSTPREYILSK